MSKSLLEKMEEAIRRPVPYEGLERASETAVSPAHAAPETAAPGPEENPQHREDFTRLVGAAARKRLPTDQT